MNTPTNDPVDILKRIHVFTDSVESIGFGDLSLTEQELLRANTTGLKDAAAFLYFAVLEMLGEDVE